MDLSTVPEDEAIRQALTEMFEQTGDVQFKLVMFHWLHKPEAEEALLAVPALPEAVVEAQWKQLCTTPAPLQRSEVAAVGDGEA